MNERIDELMRQAGIFKPKEFYQHIDALQLEKFAGLLVKECADFVENIFDDDGGHATSAAYAKGIKEHFGVH